MTINYLPKVVYNSNYSRFNKYNLTESDFFTHIQTQFYAFNRKVFDFLNKIEFWSWNRNFFEREYVISNYEISLTQILLQNGYTVKHGLSKYPYIVSTKSKIDPNYSSRNGDPNYRGAYFGATLTHQDTPLIKVNRNLLSPLHLLVISIRHLNPEYLWLSLIFIFRATFYTILEYLKMPCILIIRILKFLAKVKG